MSHESPAWENITDSSTDAPGATSQDGYVLLLVLLSIFIGGTLLLLTGILILCKRCCDSRLRLSRPSDDAEKTNTSYVDESQPTHDITIRVEDAETLSASGLRDAESERFLCTASSGRRVSFNEGALCAQEKREHERGRRYTLTEGDFHYLKNARLTLPPLPSLPPSALHILTIHESEGGESSSSGGASETYHTSPSKSNISIYQPPRSPPPPLTRLSLSLTSALPGDAYNSVADTSFIKASSHSLSPRASPDITRFDHSSHLPPGGASSDGGATRSHGGVLHFFSRLRRHASLEGASPYLKIKKWKLGSVQRASSLDTRGSPKRHQFQRQRAASESAERDDIIQYIAHTPDPAFASNQGSFIQHGTPSHSLGRIDHGDNGSLADVASTEPGQLPPQCDIWSLRASLELCTSDQSSSNNDRDSVRSDAESVSSLSGLPSLPSQDLPDGKPGKGQETETGSRKLLQMDSGYASIEAPCRPPEETCSPLRDKTASEKRMFFTHAGRKGTVFESIEGRLYEQGAVGGEEETWFPTHTQAISPRETIPSRRDYSIDEKTDALFNEFLRHDPQYDDSPLRMKHRSRTHLRKQWQRTKQYSDPGIRFPPALDRHRASPLRRGDSTSYLPDTRYHSTLPRIASSTDEEGADGCPISPTSLTSEDKIQAIEEEPCEHGPAPEEPRPPPEDPEQDYGYGPQTTELMDKIGAGLEERLYPVVQRTARSPERVCTVAHISPDHSPV